MSSASRSTLRLVLCSLVASAAMVAWAEGSHFRGGSISANVSPNGTVTVTVESLWRKTAFVSVNSIQLLNPVTLAVLQTIGSPTSTADTSDPNFSLRREVFVFSLGTRPQGAYLLRATSCCRIGGIQNAPESTWALYTKIIYNGTANGSPRLNSQVITIIGRGFEYSQNLNAVDPDGHPLQYEFRVGSNSPDFGPSSNIPGINVDTSGQISIPAANTATLGDNTKIPPEPGGDWVFKVRVTDSIGAFSERDVLLDAVTSTNQPPVLASIGNRTIGVGETISLNVTAHDPDPVQAVTLRSSTLPAGATFVNTTGNPAFGTFTFTPTAQQIGIHTINFEAFDNDPVRLTDSEQVTITVVGNNKAPVLGQVGNKKVLFGQTLQFFLTATDPNPQDTLTFSGSFLPPGASVDSATGLFTWTPSAAQVDMVFSGIVLSVTDNGAPVLSDSEAIAITVGSGNQAPKLGPLPDFIFSAPNVPIQLGISASDGDAADLITLTAVGLPGGASLVPSNSTSPMPSNATSPRPDNPATGVLRWTPAPNQTGIFSVTCVATDNGVPNLQDRFTTNFVIAAPNGQPTSVCIAPNAGQVTGGTLVVVRGTGFSAGMTVTLGGEPVVGLLIVDPFTLRFQTPAGTTAGPVDLDLQSAAGRDLVEDAFVYHAGPDRPVERLIGLIGPDGSGLLEISGAKGSVAPNSTVEFTFPASPPIVQSTTSNADGSFSHSVDAAYAQTSFLVRVSNASGQSPVTVVNAATPQIDPALLSSSPGPVAGTVIIRGGPGAVPARGELVVILPDGNGISTVAAPDGSFIVLVPTAAARAGVLLHAANCVGSVVARSTFIATNSAPDADAGQDQFEDAQPGGVSVTLDGSGSSDPDGDAITYEWTDSNNMSVGSTAQVSVTLGPGIHVFTLTVTDANVDSSTDTVTVTITDNVPPVVTVPGTITAEAADATGVTVSFTASALDDIDGSITPTCSPASGDLFGLGLATVLCSAMDASNNEGTAMFTVNVVDTTAPTVTPPGDVTAEAADANGGTASYSGGSAFDTVSGTLPITCTPASGSLFALGPNTVTCTATDGAGNTGSATFTVTIVDTTAPTVTPPGDVTAEATAANGAAVSYSGGSATDTVSGTLPFNCTPASGSTFGLGPNTVTCSATDSAGNIGTATFTVTVQDTTAPTLNLPAPITVNATSPTGANVSYAASASDAVSGSVGISCAPASGSFFATGTTTVSCTSSDAATNVATGSFSVTVLSADAQVDNLLEDLLGGAYGSDVGPIAQKLESAAAAFENGNVNAACGSLGSFENQVNAKIGKTLTAEQGQTLIDAAHAMQLAAGCK